MSSLLGNDQLKIHASCAGLIDEILGYSWDDKAIERTAPTRRSGRATTRSTRPGTRSSPPRCAGGYSYAAR
ncbi:phage terminase [Actinoplanes sp. N902-109]|nr:phage terminase [Actinoplanes sp. N902-109]